MELTKQKRILLATFGSLGDLHPFLAIAIELTARGHVPVLASSESHRGRVEAEGIAFRPIRPDPSVWEDEGALMKRVMDLKNGPRVLIRELIMPSLDATCEDLAGAAEGADLIVSHALTFPVPLIAEKLGIPWVGTAMAPLSLFSVYDWPVVGSYPLLTKLRGLGLGFAKFLRWSAKRTVRPWSEPVHELRRRLGLRTSNIAPMFEGQYSNTLNLALFSPVFAQPQRDWPPNTVATGFPFYDGGSEVGLSREVESFLDAGDAPIVFTLGSAAVYTAGDFYEQSVKAAAALGRRALLLVGKDPRNRPQSPLPDGVGMFEYAPYASVFPRAAAIVHQGGIGTTGQCLRAGRPVLVTPFAFDQPDNGDRLARLGVGRVLPRSQYSARAAERELSALLTNPRYAQRAEEIGATIAHENGARAAADAILGIS